MFAPWPVFVYRSVVGLSLYAFDTIALSYSKRLP